MHHQWIEGNLPVASKCAVCDKTCGSVIRLQDWRCMWCRACVHSTCRASFVQHCSLGETRPYTVPPTCLMEEGKKIDARARLFVACSLTSIKELLLPCCTKATSLRSLPFLLGNFFSIDLRNFCFSRKTLARGRAASWFAHDCVC